MSYPGSEHLPSRKPHRAGELIPCIGCGALAPDDGSTRSLDCTRDRLTTGDGPTFRYPDAASPGCWTIYSEILAEAYGTPWTPATLKLAVDAYSVQHPGRPTPQTAQSVTVHLISLCCMLARGHPPHRATDVMRQVIERNKGAFEWLAPPADRGAVTVVDVAGAEAGVERERRARDWGMSAWMAWSAHHAIMQRWIDRMGG